jgi:predicted DNA-binding transcriptional regulator AlpA
MSRAGTSWHPQASEGTSPTTHKELLMEKKLLDLDELATLLGRSPETIKKDLKRNRLAVPPRLHIPGTRLLRWRQSDIDSWLASHVENRQGGLE